MRGRSGQRDVARRNSDGEQKGLTYTLNVPIRFFMENIEARPRTVGAPPPVMVEVTALTRLRLDELDRLRGIGMEKAMGLRSARNALLPSPILTPEQEFQLHM